MITARLNAQPWIRQLDALQAAEQIDGRELLVREHLALTKTIVNLCPPPIGMGKAPQLLGEDALTRDVENLVSEADQPLLSYVELRYGTHNIEGEIVDKNKEAKLIKWDVLDPTGASLRELHEQYRDETGRVPVVKGDSTTWRSRVVTLAGQRDPYIELRKQNVGRFKAKFALAASLLGGKFPKWITRHFETIGGKGIAEFDLSNPEHQRIRFGAIAPRAQQLMQRKMRDALRIRVRAMKRHAQLVLSGYASDVVRKIKAAPRAKLLSFDEEAVE